MHTYTAEFRIWSEKEALDLGAISEDLGIAPTNTRQRGGARSPSSRFAESMWGYEVCAGREWEDLDDALDALLKVLMPLKSKIRGYCLKYDVVLWCGHFTSSFDGGPTFSVDLLQKLADLGIPLQLDTYCSLPENLLPSSGVPNT